MTDQQSKIADLQADIGVLKVEIRDIWELVKELSSRKFPWMPTLAISVPVFVTLSGFSMASTITINLTSERLKYLQKTIEQTAALQQKQYDIHSQQIERLQIRVEQIERRR